MMMANHQPHNRRKDDQYPPPWWDRRIGNTAVALLISVLLSGAAGVTWHFYQRDLDMERKVQSLQEGVNAKLSLVSGQLSGVEANQVSLQTQVNQIHILIQQMIQMHNR